MFNHRSYFVVLALLVTALLSFVFPLAAQTDGNQISLDHPFAAFLESRAYGASLGATAEFRKLEWVRVDSANRRLYMAMTEINEGMSDAVGDIALDENHCGIVYYADLADDYSSSELHPLVIGGPYDPNGGANPCDVNNISNPDGVGVDARGRVWIWEDTGLHANNMIWVFDPADQSLKRFGYVPTGAEVTGVYITAEGTLFFNAQHPDPANPYPYNAGVVMVVNGFNANTDDFEPIAVPEGDAQRMAGVAVGSIQIIARSGDPIPASSTDDVFGAIHRVDGSTIMVSNSPDGNMWLLTDDTGAEGWLYTNFEGIPGGVGRLTLQHSGDNWTAVEGHMVDFSSVNGTWINCGASVTPWNTALTSEELEPNANDFNNVGGMTDYLGRNANPYDYGYIVELAPDGSADSVTKHYVMGRFSHEVASIAADQRTAYFGDDGSNTMMFRFVAAQAGDLSAGTLYAAHLTQRGGTGADHYFLLDWIELGSSTDADIESAIRELDR